MGAALNLGAGALLGICHRTISSKRGKDSIKSLQRKAHQSEPKTFGDYLRKQRLDSGTLRTELAGKLGVSDSTIDKWECDKTTPPNIYRCRIANFLGFNPWEDTKTQHETKR
jgi:ribosome-binding protein aMBF1 (putative translation factor)